MALQAIHEIAGLHRLEETTKFGVAGNATEFIKLPLRRYFGVGSNHTLFFERGNTANASPERTVTSLVFCNLSTVIGFGVIGSASTPVLSAIGTTVAIGAFLSLVFAAILSARMLR